MDGTRYKYTSLSSRNDCQEAEHDADQHEIVARRVRIPDDPVAGNSININCRKLKLCH